MQTATDPAALSSQPGLPPNIHAHCKLFDLNGQLLRSVPGLYCIFENDGSTVLGVGQNLTKLDKDFKTVWQVPVVFIHHHIRKSPFSGDYLLIDSAIQMIGGKSARSDVLRVVSADGKARKTVNFNTLMKQFKAKGAVIRPFARAYWLDKYSRDVKENYEYSHVNSFYEYADGYIVNCYYQKKILFLDKSLSRITDLIDVSPRAIHDVQIKEPGKLLFYQNFSDFDAETRFSSIVELDLQTRVYKELYSAKSAEYSARACGSVQQLGGERYLITHSSCTPASDAVNSTVLEFVDLNTKTRSVLTFDKEFKFGAAELIDASEYLKNNKGQ